LIDERDVGYICIASEQKRLSVYSRTRWRYRIYPAAT